MIASRRRAFDRGAVSLLAAAMACFIAFLVLGFNVAAHGEPPALWTFAQSARGHALGLAWAFTNAGWPRVLVPLAFVSLAVAVVVRAWRVRAIGVVLAALVSWRLADAFQHWFARPRRPDWLIKHELTFSYPSSHAAVAIGFYFLWGILLLRSDLPGRVRTAAFALLTAIAAGILWARLALAAHYPTDVLGGALLGAAVSLLAVAAVKVLAPPGPRP